LVLWVVPCARLRLARNAIYVLLLEMKPIWMCYHVSLVQRGRSEGETFRPSLSREEERTGWRERDADRYKQREGGVNSEKEKEKDKPRTRLRYIKSRE